eukprot:NODE_189_length_15604_cov_0.314802.p7 type:complete len:125 gc:universal NODE_189_length_15604_cov_0.314802:9186-9560(+)
MSHDCKPIKCPYYDVCGSTKVKYSLDIHRGYCMNCAVLRYNLGNKETDEKYEKAKRLQKCFGCCDGRINDDDVCTCPPKPGCCHSCKRRLVAIGYDRVNGRDHPDWESRTLHKKCWMELRDSEE